MRGSSSTTTGAGASAARIVAASTLGAPRQRQQARPRRAGHELVEVRIFEPLDLVQPGLELGGQLAREGTEVGGAPRDGVLDLRPESAGVLDGVEALQDDERGVASCRAERVDERRGHASSVTRRAAW